MQLRSVKNEQRSYADSGQSTPTPTFLGIQPRLKRKQLAVYSRQVATLLKAKVPIVQALKVLRKQETKGVLAGIISSQIADLEEGRSFSSSLRNFPSVFDRMYVSLVVAGEKAGVLDSVMARLAHYLERSVQTSGKIKSAMTYPVVVLVASIVIVCGLLIFVVPQFEDIFETMLQGAAMPVMTRWVMGISDFVQSSWLWILLAAIVSYIVGNTLLRIPPIRFRYDQMKLMVPAFGDIVRKSLVARFCRTLGTLLDSAVPILDALETATQTVNNKVIEGTMARVRTKIRDGLSMAESLANEKPIPPVVVGMIEVGEATGDLPSMLVQVAETYEQEVEVGIDGITTLIEPLMILVLAVIIAFLVISLFLPIVEIMQHLGT